MNRQLQLHLFLEVRGGRWCVWNEKDKWWVRLRKGVNPEVVTKELDLLVEKLKAVD